MLLLRRRACPGLIRAFLSRLRKNIFFPTDHLIHLFEAVEDFQFLRGLVRALAARVQQK